MGKSTNLNWCRISFHQQYYPRGQELSPLHFAWTMWMYLFLLTEWLYDCYVRFSSFIVSNIFQPWEQTTLHSKTPFILLHMLYTDYKRLCNLHNVVPDLRLSPSWWMLLLLVEMLHPCVCSRWHSFGILIRSAFWQGMELFVWTSPEALFEQPVNSCIYKLLKLKVRLFQ